MSKYFKILLVILCIAPIAQFGTDIYVPALPKMVAYFNSNASSLQWTITIYLLSFSLGQPIVGPFSDSYGRKPVLIVGLSVFLLGSILAAYTDSLSTLYVARLIQGLGITSTAIMLKAIAADCFTGIELVKVMTYALTAYGVGPIVAPVIGAYLADFFDWHANFIALAIYALLLLVLIASFNETNQNIQKLNFKTVLVNNWTVLKHKQFLFTFICGGVCFATAYSFNVLAPFTIQEDLHYSLIQYGYFSLIVGGSYLVGGMINRVLIHYVSSQRIVSFGLLLSLVVSLIMLIAANFLPHSLVTILVPSMILVFICGIVNPHFFATGMSIFPKLIGTAGALSGFVMMLTAATAVFIISKLNAHSFITLPSILLLNSCISLGCYYLFVKKFIK